MRAGAILKTLPLLTAVALAACTATAKKEEATPDLRGMYTGQPAPNQWPATEPGKSEKIGRFQEMGPTLVSHTTKDMFIDREENDCLDCHVKGEPIDGSVPTKIPESHYKNLKTGEVSKGVDGMRYYCVNCHVPQSKDNPPERAAAR